jgi:hypothetical protein
MLPNQASVSASNFNNGQPITSNTVIIDLNDGMPQLAAAAGIGASASLTPAELQPVVGQAVAAWRAAGADPLALSNVANYGIHIANLPDGELGWEVPGQIWLDPTAAGWGWSLDGAPGQMDLLTVVSHEVGHVLGFGDHAGGNDVMTTTLAAGVRRLPEAPSGTSTVVAAATTPGDSSIPVVAGAGELAVAQPGVPLSTLSGTGAGGTAFTGVRRGGLALPLPAAAALPAAAGIFQDGAGHLRLLPGVPLNLGPQAPPVLSIAPAAPAAGAAGTDRDSTNDLVPGLRPPVSRVDSGGATPAGDEEPDEVPADRPAPRVEPAGTPVDQEAAAAIGRRQARDAFFASDCGIDGPGAASGQGLVPAAMVVTLGMLGGHWSASQPEPKPRRRFLS